MRISFVNRCGEPNGHYQTCPQLRHLISMQVFTKTMHILDARAWIREQLMRLS